MHRKPPKTLPLRHLLSMASLLALTLLLLSTTALRRRDSPIAAADSPPLYILQACNATRFPTSCLSALSSTTSPSPTDLILAALSASSSALPTANSLVQPLLPTTPSPLSTAVNNCLAHLSLSSHRLSAAASALPHLPNARAFTSAALLYQYDCWSVLKYVNSTSRVAAAMSFISSLTDLTSNALSLIFALQRFGPDPASWGPPQTERDGYWGSTAGGGSGGIPDLKPSVTVCNTGDCDYETIQSAIESAPDYSSSRFVIYIKAGVYNETVRVPFQKTNLAFMGDGMGATIITGELNAQMPRLSTYNTATVAVAGDGFMARGITFQNTAGAGAHQAVAFMSDSDRSILESVEIAGHQDSLYARSLRQLYRNCRISGTVDFIFGNSAAVFESCELVVVPRLGTPEKGESNAVTAQGRTDPAQATGFVFRNCSVDGSGEYLRFYRQRPGRHKVYLGRPWKEYSRTVFVGCYLGEVVRAEGWLPWRGEFALATLFYGEFGSSGPGANETARVAWSSRIPAEHVGVYSVGSFIQGDEWIPSNQ